MPDFEPPKTVLYYCACCSPPQAVDFRTIIGIGRCDTCEQPRLVSPCRKGWHRFCLPCIQAQAPWREASPSRSGN